LKKFILALASAAVLAFAATAAAETLYVADPTPTGTFTGTYACPTATNPDQTCAQQGYVQLSNDGGPEVQACNGNEGLTRPDDGQPIQGYAYLSPTGSGPASPSTGGNQYIGASDDTETGGSSPCPAGS
jgi:hypothetical protein